MTTSLGSICVKKKHGLSSNISWRGLNEEYINVDPEEYVFCVVTNKEKGHNWHTCLHLSGKSAQGAKTW